MNGDIDQNYSDKLQFLQFMYTVYLPVLLKNAKGKRKIKKLYAMFILQD